MAADQIFVPLPVYWSLYQRNKSYERRYRPNFWQTLHCSWEFPTLDTATEFLCNLSPSLGLGVVQCTGLNFKKPPLDCWSIYFWRLKKRWTLPTRTTKGERRRTNTEVAIERSSKKKRCTVQEPTLSSLLEGTSQWAQRQNLATGSDKNQHRLNVSFPSPKKNQSKLKDKRQPVVVN